jgi:hypothetical protein
MWWFQLMVAGAPVFINSSVEEGTSVRIQVETEGVSEGQVAVARR